VVSVPRPSNYLEKRAHMAIFGDVSGCSVGTFSKFGLFFGFKHNLYNHLLVVGIPIYPSEKYEFVSWDDEIPN